MYEQPYSAVNTTHWIQCTNDQNSLKVFPGDTRITMMYVAPLDSKQYVGHTVSPIRCSSDNFSLHKTGSRKAVCFLGLKIGAVKNFWFWVKNANSG